MPSFKYTEEIDNVIREYYSNTENEFICQMLKKQFGIDLTVSRLADHATKILKLRKERCKVYTEEMDNFLRENFLIKGNIQLVKEFNEKFGENKSRGCILARANKLGLKRDEEFSKKLASEGKRLHQGYTNEVINFLKENYSTFTNEELQKQLLEKFGLNKSVENIVMYCNKLNIHKNTDVRKKIYKEIGKKNTRVFDQEIIDYAKENFANKSAFEMKKEIKEKFGIDLSYDMVKKYLGRNLGLKKSKEFLENQRKESLLLAKEKQQKPIGYEIINSKGDGKKAVYIKYTCDKGGNKNYMKKDRYIYEKAYGKTPDDYVFYHLDDNFENCELNNLVAMNKNVWSIVSKQITHLEKKEDKLLFIEYAKLKYEVTKLKGER